MAGGSKKVILAGVTANALIAVSKFVASGITGSAAMFSEGIHSTVDTGNQLLLLYGLGRANRPADRAHPFGYSREIYFWSFVVAILIFAVGAGVSIYEGVHKVMHPAEVHDPMVNYIVLGVAFVIEGWAWYVAFKEFNSTRGERGLFQAIRHTKDPAVMAVLLEDTAAMLGLMIAAAGLMLGQILNLPVMDGVASLAIGGILALVAVILAIETKGLLIGEAADEGLIDAVHKLADENPDVSVTNEVLTMHMGPADVLLNLSLDFRDGMSAGEVEQTVTSMESRIKANFPEVKRIFIEAQSFSAHNQAERATQ